MSFTTSRIDGENAQSIRTPFDTAIMVGPVERFHTSYNKFTRETSSVDSNYYLIRSDGMAFGVTDEDEFNELCSRRALNMKYSDYSTAGNRSRYFVERDNAWGATVNAAGLCTQKFSFYLGKKPSGKTQDLWSIVFDKIEGDVTCKITFEYISSGHRETEIVIPAGVHNFIRNDFLYSTNWWQKGGKVTVEMTAQNKGESFNCVAFGPGIMAMFTPETLISIDASLKTVLNPDASVLPASTIDIHALIESYPDNWDEPSTNYKEGLKYIKENTTITFWQGYADAKTINGKSYPAEMVNRTFYFTADDELQAENNTLHIQARDKVSDLENTTTGFMFLTLDGKCLQQGSDPWMYGDEKRGPRVAVKDRYGFLMGALYKAVRCAGDDFYVECDDIEPYTHETDNPIFDTYISRSRQYGPYDFRWSDEYYEQYNSLGNNSMPEYEFMGFIPDRAPRPLIAWMMNAYRIDGARVMKPDGTTGGTTTALPFYPQYVDAGKPRITLKKPTAQLKIKEADVADIQRVLKKKYSRVSFADGSVRVKSGSTSTDEIKKLAEKTVDQQIGTYTISFLCGSEPVSRIVRRDTKRTNTDDGYEQTEGDPVITNIDLSESEAEAAFHTAGKYLYTYYDSNNREYKEKTGYIRINKVQAFNSTQTLGDTNYTMLYEWLSEPLQKDESMTTWDLDTESEGRTLVIDYHSYMARAQIGRYNGNDDFDRPGSGMSFKIANVTGSFTFRGDPRLQPHDVFTLSQLDGTNVDCTIEALDIHYEQGGTIETISYMEGIK